MNTLTENRLKQLSHDWLKVSKEPIQVEQIKGSFYAFGSELAVLRLFKYYSGNYLGNKKVASGYSENKKNWYFVLETEL